MTYHHLQICWETSYCYAVIRFPQILYKFSKVPSLGHYYMSYIWATSWENLPLHVYAKTKAQISCAELISVFVFAIKIVQPIYFMNPKFQASNYPLWLYIPVCVGPAWKPMTGFLATQLIWAASWENRLFTYAKTKTQISFAVTAKLISASVFTRRIVQFLYYINTKFQASSHLLWLYSPVCVRPGRQPRRLVFSERGSYRDVSMMW